MWSLLMEVEALFCISIMAAYVVDAFIFFFSDGVFHAERNGKLICAARWSITSAGTDGLTCAGLEGYDGLA